MLKTLSVFICIFTIAYLKQVATNTLEAEPDQVILIIYTKNKIY
jgi:hypothetical protein